MGLLLYSSIFGTANIAPRRYMASSSHQPDKGPLWVHPVDEDGWMHAHNAVRGEIDIMTAILSKIGDRPLEAWEILSLQAWYDGHVEHVHDHHANEDAKFTPHMATRINLPAKLTTDHVPLLRMLEKLGRSINTLREGKSPGALKRDWARYDALMKPHLREEEQVALPLLRAYFTPGEVGKLVESILSESPPLALGSFFYFMGGTRASCAKFMANEGIPFFVWFVSFRGMVNLYHERMVRHSDALLRGVPPSPAAGSTPPTALVLTVLVLVVSALAYRRSRRARSFSTQGPVRFSRKAGCPSTPKRQGAFQAAWPKPLRC